MSLVPKEFVAALSVNERVLLLSALPEPRVNSKVPWLSALMTPSRSRRSIHTALLFVILLHWRKGGYNSRELFPSEPVMRKCTLVLSLLPLLLLLGWAQETKPAPKTSYSPIPVTDARRPNPVKPTPESIARGKKIYTYDCAQCHGAAGDGKTDAGKNLKIPNFTRPAVLKDRTDGELFYVIKHGRGNMPPEGDRVKPDEIWDLVNYLRSLAKEKDTAEEKPSS